MKTRKPIFPGGTNYPLFESLSSLFMLLFHQKSFLLLLPFFISASAILAHPIDRHNLDSSKSSKALWPLVDQHLESADLDSSLNIIFLLTRGHCQQDFNCQTAIYSKLMFELERKFNLPAAIRVAGEIVKIAQLDHNTSSLASAHLNLHRFHDALGNERESILNMEKALELFEKVGNTRAITNIRLNKLEASLRHQKIEVVLPKIEALLEESVAAKDTFSTNHLHLRLIYLNQKAGKYEDMERHVKAVEKITLSTPINSREYAIAIYRSLGRADLFRFKNELDSAEKHYHQALKYSQEEPSKWVEIKILQNLTELEMERKQLIKAKSYLNSAQTKANALHLDDLLSEGYALEAKIAEKEKRFAEALDYTKKKQFHENKFKSKSAGFDAKSFYLEKEKEQLAAEKERHKLQLRLKESQLRNSFIIIALGLMLITALGLGYHNQIRSKSRLAYQNNLIQDQANKLAQLDSAKTRFFANVSHELRTPLTLLLGPIKSLIKEKQLSKKQLKLLRLADDSGQQLEQLVTEILDLGKLDIGKLELTNKPTELRSFFHPYLVQFESLAHRKNIEYTVDLQLNHNLEAAIDREKCRQVLFNLLSNAFKFTPQGGTINASVFVEKNTLHMVVSDSGPGIHANDIPQLFDRYFQTNQSDKPAAGGTGIGLALCHEYAQLFSGQIDVESEVGQGAVFHFHFPVEIKSIEVQLGDSRVLNNKNWDVENQEKIIEKEVAVINHIALIDGSKREVTKPTIMVVEDNPKLQEYMQLILSDTYDVVCAENGQTALNILKSLDNCTLIVSDLMMPVMDGYQLLDELKSNDSTRHIPIIMLTARADVNDKLKALRLGVDDYILKPFQEEELMVRMDNLLKNVSARKAVSAEANEKNKVIDQQNKEALDINTPPESEEITEQSNRSIFLSAADNDWLARLEENLQNELTKFNFKLEHLAELMLVSRRQLGRQVKALTGLTPSEYLLEARMQKARNLLNENHVKTVKEAAYTVGLRDVKHFSRQFRQRFGKPPSDFLNS